MNSPTIRRRSFLQTIAAGTAAAAMSGLARSAAASVPAFLIDEPFHGAVLNRRHGTPVDGGLKIQVSGQAPLQIPVTVNGQPARRAGAQFTAGVVLRDRETDLVAAADSRFGRQEHRVRVVWDRNSFPRYRFSIDDNIYFLRDIFRNNYRSLFDCFYLKGLRDLNRKYGTRYTLNLFYTYATDDDFQLKQFPDRYKSEWKDNAGWLRLAFHAYSNAPARPYQYAPPEKVIADLDLVAGEIHRFAGAEAYAPPTIIHWGEVQQASLKPLYQRGVRVLSGYFTTSDGVNYSVHYMLDEARCEYLSRHDALKDFQSGIVFAHTDIVINATPVDKIVPKLAPLAADPNQAEIMDLLTHEPQFWPSRPNYVPDHFQRVDTALRWVTEHGYKPVFYHEGFLGAPL
jgi:hypothetical protein